MNKIILPREVAEQVKTINEGIEGLCVSDWAKQPGNLDIVMAALMTNDFEVEPERDYVSVEVAIKDMLDGYIYEHADFPFEHFGYNEETGRIDHLTLELPLVLGNLTLQSKWFMSDVNTPPQEEMTEEEFTNEIIRLLGL